MQINALIIEDEVSNSSRLERLLKDIEPGINILAVLESVEDSVLWLEQNTLPDLIFMDVQLADGLCFEIFDHVNIAVPLIFTTAYDEYAIQAFKVNSVDYLLKPVDPKSLNQAIDKYRTIHGSGRGAVQAELQNLIRNMQSPKTAYKSRFLVKQKNVYISILTQQISCFILQNQLVYLYVRDGNKYIIDQTLDILIENLDPSQFFRINRQVIINTAEILKIEEFPGYRLRVFVRGKIYQDLIVSRDRVIAFKEFLNK